ncbi:MAG: hypothetical protein JO272_04490 [Pseudonocardiales bacterium]|nr:hypothetical protein [Pseudonocardiales bacterium]
MSANLLTDPNVIVAVIAATIGVVVRAWVSLRMVHLREKSLTDRLARALQDSSPPQRPEIIRALSTLADQPSEAAAGRSVLDWLMLVRRTPPSAKD